MRVVFRDGEREVPDHLAELMGGLNTISMTYEQAVKEADTTLIRRHLDTVQDGVIREHFSRWGRG